jgi:predicted glycosyltransferase
MKRVWLDILTPKQFWYFRSVAGFLRDRGVELFVTSRSYEQVLPLLDNFGYCKVVVVGEFGGAGLRGKLLKSVERTAELLKVVGDFDCAVSSGSPEAARIAYGVGVPHILASDTPHSPVNKLTAPLSSSVLTPWVINKREWTVHGVPPSKITHYRGLDPAAWLKNFTPEISVPRGMGLEPGGYVLVRSPEYKASYLLGSGWGLDDFYRFVVKLSEKMGRYRVVLLARYGDEAMVFEDVKRENLTVVERPVTDLSLLYYSAMFVGGGGTMTQEAALMGVPTVSIYPGRLPTVLRYLAEKKLVKHLKSRENLVDRVLSLAGRLDRIRDFTVSRARRLLDSMENPAQRVAEAVLKTIA